MSLGIDELQRLTEIFRKLKWRRSDRFARPDKTVFDLVAEMLSALTPDQRQLIFTLLPSFLWIKGDDYFPQFRIALETIPNSLFDNRENIVVVPLSLNPSDMKSGLSLIYPAPESLIPALGFSIGKTVKKFITIDRIPKDDPPSVILVIDDFIGTSDSAESVITKYKNNYQNRDDIIAFVSIVCMAEGQRRLLEAGYQVFSAFYPTKGISENDVFDSDEQRDRARSTMTEIENYIEAKQEERFGHGRSESQVAMLRTPDNTFPIYRIDHQGPPTWYAPFPRKS